MDDSIRSVPDASGGGEPGAASSTGATISDHPPGPSSLPPELGESAASPGAELLAALEGADSLPLDERLALLQRVEAGLSEALEGLDGL
jgi:hypothetical protein